ncbi:hypothetical protein SUVZ_15G0340 [Saccharomyces uvarum]|uniref:RRM domain-containing protein n=1 Tax=Saccharomyces uvarum TaxID=230603 RepID=A0ABN8WPX3_SACUV|nr:hypothetical protein SUVZ_15G0340 [Saccharomyces uvarum]
MSSDEEDFNDIYGDDKPTTTDEVKKDEEQKKTDSGTSQLDQLAALQALSSSLNKLNNPNSNNSSSNNNSNENSSSSKQDGTANDKKEGSNEETKNEKPLENTASNANANVGSAAPSGLPWEQLQQTMSQFQQPSSQSPPAQQQITQTKEERLKADLSKESCKMFIGGLNWDTTEDNLREYFGKYGTVTDLKIMKDPATGRSRGFGFLSFEKPSSVDEVVKTQHILDGKVIDPKRAIPRDEQDKTGKIFVGGIGPDVRPKEFEEFFSQWGTIIDAQLMLDKDTGQSRGFGFVTYDSADAVDRVCQNKFIDFKDRKIEIKRAEPRHMQQKSSNGGNNNAGGNNSGNSGNMNRRGGNFGNQGDFNQMYQNPMMGGYNPMMNPQAMTDYYQKMQEYYQQMQKQTGMDYTQMYQQQMQQMAMMMPGFAMPPNAMTLNQPQQDSNTAQGSPTPSDSDNNKSNDVQTIGNTSNTESGSPPLNLPNGPKGPSSQYSDDHNSGYGYNRDRGDRDRGDRGDRNDRDYNHRSGGNHRRNGRGGRGGGYNNRRNNGYHPYNR